MTRKGNLHMNDPVTMRRKLRGELKRLRLARGLTQKQVAEELVWSQSKVIRIENGSVAVGVTDLRALLLMYGTTDQAVIGDLVEMAKGSRKLPFSEYKDVHKPETLRYFAYEASAAIVRQFAALLVPGLLQTEEYARALLRSWNIAPPQIDTIWQARQERQELLERPDAPEMFFILDEAVIRRLVGGEDVMRSQLSRLLELSKLPRVTVQVLPFEHGAHPGMRGPFVYLEFPGSDDPDVLYLEGQLGDSVFRDEDEVTGPYLDTFFALERASSAANDLEKALGTLLH